MNLKKFYDTDEIDALVEQATNDKNLEIIKKTLTNKCYENLTQDEKEEAVFLAIYHECIFESKDDKFLKYIIFDYKIKEEISVEKILKDDLDQKVKVMFDTRRLNEELNHELDSYQNTPLNKLKL